MLVGTSKLSDKELVGPVHYGSASLMAHFVDVGCIVAGITSGLIALGRARYWMGITSKAVWLIFY